MLRLFKASLLGIMICCLVVGTQGCREKDGAAERVPEEEADKIESAGEADDARVEEAKTHVVVFKRALDAFKFDIGCYPSQEDGLDALLERPSAESAERLWKGPYLDVDEIPLDPWGNEYIYRLSEERDTGVERVEIISLGKDGVQGGEGYNADISSRELLR